MELNNPLRNMPKRAIVAHEDSRRNQSSPALNTTTVTAAAPIQPVSEPVQISNPVSFDRDTLIAMAAKAGLVLAKPKKEYVKHSYSVTSETRDRFKKHCKQIDKTMAEAFEEALTEYIAKGARR